ncbi:MAG: glycosyl hydrolase family 3 [Gammaproteobacteria bacterium]|nr:glycosyl hydrolase family 3 [Gammaproteobacteria bacterium]
MKTEVETPAASMRQQLAQKLILDFRYYCPTKAANSGCNVPMTQLPKEVAELISTTDLGGVILFADNLESVEQIVTLNHDLQKTSVNSELKLPLFISVDQEGGRVARLPRDKSTAFTGSMSIAATYPLHGLRYARETGKVLGQELVATGFNLNFAPTVDVNINPANPVINVRSFGEDPHIVSELAAAQLDAMQSQELLGTLKHFPGHGDTSVDSHTGLPRVDHDKAKVEQVDLAPFRYAIDLGTAKVIMTAHIQYPELDNTTFVSKTGEVMVKPATMSKKILTDLLRGEMNYQGLVITDALNMKGISHFFDETQAVIETFKAGSDIALMPIAIRSPYDLKKLHDLLDNLEQAVNDGRLDKSEISSSYERIRATKLAMLDGINHSKTLAEKLSNAKQVLATAQAKQLEQELALASLTAIKGTGQLSSDLKKLALLMPDESKCKALENALIAENQDYNVNCINYLTFDEQKLKTHIKNADVFVAGSVTPNQSLAEMGGVEDWPRLKQLSRQSKLQSSQKKEKLNALLKFAKSNNKQTVFVSLRMPYEAPHYAEYSDHMLATFSYNQHRGEDGKLTGAVYQALAKVLSGKEKALGQSPVTINFKR